MEKFIYKPSLLKIFLFLLIFIFLIPFINIAGSYAKEFTENAESYRTKGYEAQERGDIDGAIEWYQKAAGLVPSYAAPHNDLGILFETKGWLDRAEAEYQKAISIDPNYKEAHANLALLYERKGELEKAAFHWLKRYKLGKGGDPWTEEARHRLEKLGLIDKAVDEKVKIETELREQPQKKVEKKEPSVSAWERIGLKKNKKIQEPKKKSVKPIKKVRPKKPIVTVPTTAPKPRVKITPETPIEKKVTKKVTTKPVKPVTKTDLNSQLQESLRHAEERLREERAREIKDAGKIEKKEPVDPQASTYYSRSKDYYNKGEYAKALDIIRSARNTYPADQSLINLEQDIKNKMKEEKIEDYYSEGIKRYHQKDFSGARKEFESILNILPE